MSSETQQNTTLALILGLRTPFYTTIARGAQSTADALGVELLVDAPDVFDADLQTVLVDTYIARQVDAIIIAPCDDQVLIAPLQRAHEAGIPVITVDSYIGDGNYISGPVTFPLAYIGSDNLQGGRLAGQALLEISGGQGRVYIQSTRPGLSATDQREQGFLDVIQTTNGTLSLIGTGYDGGSIALAAEQTRIELCQHPTLSAIFSTGDFSTRGVMQALRETDRGGSCHVVRFDCSEEAITDLRAGTIDVIIAQLPGEMGRIGVERAFSALHGGLQAEEKYVATSFVVIDRSNIDTPQAQAVVYRG